MELESPQSIAIILTTYHRHNRLPWLVSEVYRTAQVPFNLYFAVEDDDHETIETVKSLKGTTILCSGRTAVSAQNYAYTKTTESIVGLISDDLEFNDGWLRKVIEHFDSHPTIMVIANGASDNGGQTCDRGCATFIMRREYIDKYGAIDQPGVIYHPGYKHTFSDEEFWKTATFRGVACFHTGAWLIHSHWNLNTKYPHDETYHRSEAWGREDCETFQKRRNMFRG